MQIGEKNRSVTANPIIAYSQNIYIRTPGVDVIIEENALNTTAQVPV